MRRLNRMEPRLFLFPLTKICLLVILLSGSLVQTKKNNFKEFQSKPSKIPSTNLRTGTDSSLPSLRFRIYWNTNTMKQTVCGAKWIKNVLERNLPQRLLPLSNNDINILLWDMVDALGVMLSEDIHWWTGSNEVISYYVGSFGYWSNPTEYKPDHEIYDEIWNSFLWRDAKKGFLTSKDALNFITQLHLALQSSRQDAELTMLMDFFDQPLYFDNNPRLKSFPPSKTGDSFLSNFKLPAQIRSLMPRDMSLVKAIEEAQDMVSFDRKELKYNLRVLNVRTLYLQLVNRRCQPFKTPATQKIGCGEPLPKARIVGGNIAKQGSWPWMAYLTISPRGASSYKMCGGSLISDRHVLTAAHCVVGNPAENVRAYLGEFDRDEFEYSSTEYEAEKIFSHEHHGNVREGNDIALIKLKEKVIFNNDRRPICLPPPNITLAGKIAFMAGWGRTTEGGYSSTKLLEGFALILTDAECRKALWNVNIQNLICMGGDGKVDTCQGDSGGPIMYQTPSGQWMVVGIVSWGSGCARVGYPGASVRVSTYLDWINARLIL